MDRFLKLFFYGFMIGFLGSFIAFKALSKEPVIEVDLSEHRYPIAVIDTGLNFRFQYNEEICKSINKDFTGEGLSDFQGHGTNVTGIIAKKINKKKYCILVLKWYNGDTEDNTAGLRIASAVNYAVANNAKVINMSLTGIGHTDVEKDAIYNALIHGVKIVVAAGNDGRDLSDWCIFYPACYNFHNENLFVVGSLDSSGKRSKSSNYGGPVNTWMFGEQQEGYGTYLSGTSMAAANFTAVLSSE